MKPTYKPRRPLSWFIKRIGKEIVLNNKFNLFNPPILVESEGHAKGLYAWQDKGHRFN
jgi:hypothetical protein